MWVLPMKSQIVTVTNKQKRILINKSIMHLYGQVMWCMVKRQLILI